MIVRTIPWTHRHGLTYIALRGQNYSHELLPLFATLSTDPLDLCFTFLIDILLSRRVFSQNVTLRLRQEDRELDDLSPVRGKGVCKVKLTLMPMLVHQLKLVHLSSPLYFDVRLLHSIIRGLNLVVGVLLRMSGSN